MIRIVLAGDETGHWRTYRQAQWMNIVRSNPTAAGWSKIHLDIEESQYLEALAGWDREALGNSQATALAALTGRGAIEIRPR